GAHRAVDVVPGVHHAQPDQPVDPFLGEQVVDVRLTQAGADAGEEFVGQAVADALHGFVQNAGPAAALVADGRVPLHADEGGYVAELPQALGPLGGDELAVGEDLEVAGGVRGEHVDQVRVHERLA